MTAPSLDLPHYHSRWQTTKLKKLFKLHLAQEKLEFQEALTQAASSLVF